MRAHFQPDARPCKSCAGGSRAVSRPCMYRSGCTEAVVTLPTARASLPVHPRGVGARASAGGVGVTGAAGRAAAGEAGAVVSGVARAGRPVRHSAGRAARAAGDGRGVGVAGPAGGALALACRGGPRPCQVQKRLLLELCSNLAVRCPETVPRTFHRRLGFLQSGVELFPIARMLSARQSAFAAVT